MILLLVILFFHIIFSIAAIFLIWTGVLKVPKAFVPVLILVPFWGEVSALACHMLRVFEKDGRLTPGVERLEAEGEAYRSVAEPDRDSVVLPLEEVLVLNDSETKRNMILDILGKNPGEYMNLLREAGENEDVEVVHYAATAMSELSKEYDLRLQRLEAAYAANQADEKLLKEYAVFLEDYIDKGIAQGQFLTMQRNQYSLLLQRLIDRYGDMEYYVKKVENELELENYEESARLLGIMGSRWPGAEQYWLLKIRHHAQQMEGNKVQEVIREIQDKNIYMTAEGKSMVEFWSGGVV